MINKIFELNSDEILSVSGGITSAEMASIVSYVLYPSINKIISSYLGSLYESKIKPKIIGESGGTTGSKDPNFLRQVEPWILKALSHGLSALIFKIETTLYNYFFGNCKK